MPYKPQKGVQIPPHQPSDISRRVVENGVLNGFTHKQIASVLDICEMTLRKHYEKELANGKELLITKATDRLRQKFMFNDEMLEKDPKVVAQSLQFFLNSKGGWNKQQDVNLGASNNVKIDIKFDETPEA